MKALQIFIMITLCLVTFSVEAQLNIKDKLKNQTSNKANKSVDQSIDKSLDAVENNVKDLFKKKKPGEETQENTSEVQNNETTQEQKPIADSKPALAAYSKFDFIPGEKVIFYDDFSQDAVGDFPALYNTNGSAEIVTTNLYPGNWMKYSTRGCIWTDQLLTLPDNYTLEFDVVPIAGDEGRMAGWSFRLMKSINQKSWDGGAVPGVAGFNFEVEYFGRSSYRAYNNNLDGEFWDQKGYNEDEKNYQKLDQKYHMSVWVQKTRIRIYQNEIKLFDAPRGIPDPSARFDRIRFEENAAMISNIRIAVGAPDTRNKLMTEGKLITYGIYFDVNKDLVKPESYGTLKDIAAVLNEVPDVKVKIVGHTDSDGQDDANLDLSKRRADSVKAELTKSFGVNADRLITDGLGETQPVTSNDTPVNKALNRRVEFIKL